MRRPTGFSRGVNITLAGCSGDEPAASDNFEGSLPAGTETSTASIATADKCAHRGSAASAGRSRCARAAAMSQDHSAEGPASAGWPCSTAMSSR
jgi:hypothetical protein